MVRFFKWSGLPDYSTGFGKQLEQKQIRRVPLSQKFELVNIFLNTETLMLCHAHVHKQGCLQANFVNCLHTKVCEM